jgi:aminocarboxymuconate-semialdehyde decarboxylase
MKFLIDLFGADRIAVGSDYPYPLGEDHAGAMIKNMQIDKKIKEQILEKTALEWLGVERERFV